VSTGARPIVTAAKDGRHHRAAVERAPQRHHAISATRRIKRRYLYDFHGAAETNLETDDVTSPDERPRRVNRAGDATVGRQLMTRPQSPPGLGLHHSVGFMAARPPLFPHRPSSRPATWHRGVFTKQGPARSRRSYGYVDLPSRTTFFLTMSDRRIRQPPAPTGFGAIDGGTRRPYRREDTHGP